MSETSTPPNIESILDQLVDAGSLGELLSEKEVKAGIISELRDLSVPFPGLVYLLILSAVNGSATFLGDSIKGRIFTFVTKQPKLAILLQKILELQQGEKNKYKIKNALLEKSNQKKEMDLAALKVDENESLDTLLALHNIQGFQNILGKLDKNERDLFDYFRSELENLFYSMVEPSLCWPDEVINKDALGAFDKLKYSAGIDTFLGRDNDIDMLHHFVGDLSMCGERHAFRWMILTGEGGIGKTRLAYHFTRKVLDSSRWKTGKLDFSDIPSHEDMRKWRPGQPTFIVIDYAQTHPEKIGELMRMLSHNAKFFDFPIRLLLLERRAEAAWTDKLLPNDGNRAMVLEHCFGAENISGRQLSPLLDRDIIALMTARFCRSNIPPPSDDTLLTAARQIDNSRVPRPLFAAAAAEALIAAQYTNRATPALDRETVLNGIIERERQLRWQKVEGVSAPKLRQYEVLLALATYVQGFDFSNLDEVCRLDKRLERWLPEPPPHHIPALITAMGGDEEALPQLEPDILGEFFLLKQLEVLKGHGVSLLAAGVVINQPRPVITLLRVLQDFPDLFPHHLLIQVLRDAENKHVAEAMAWISPDYVSDAVKRGLLFNLFEFFDALTAARLFFNSSIIAFQESKSIFNVITRAGALGNWSLVDSMLIRFDALREAFPSNQGFAQDLASVLFNITNHACAEDNWKLVDAMLTRLDTLRKAFPANCEIALDEGKTAFNIANYVCEANNWKQVDSMLARIDALRLAFPNYEELVLQEIKVAVNVIHYAGKAGLQTLVDAMLVRINTLRQTFPNHNEIAYQEAIAALNITNNAGAAGKWLKVESTFVHYDTLRKSLPDYERSLLTK